jgi:hypothetical protein
MFKQQNLKFFKIISGSNMGHKNEVCNKVRKYIHSVIILAHLLS